MLTLTQAAGAHLADILAERDCADDIAVRLVCAESRRSLALDGKKTGDATFEHKGRTVLLIDEKAGQLLDGRTVDVKKTDTGEQLFLARKGARSV
jgi:Fe-S cluster assembly iron-binding protein IscA